MNRYWAAKVQVASPHPLHGDWTDAEIDRFKIWFDIELDIYYFASSIFWKRIRQYSVERYLPEYDASSDFDLGDVNVDTVARYLKADDVVKKWISVFPSAQRNIFQEWKYDTTTTTSTTVL